MLRICIWVVCNEYILIYCICYKTSNILRATTWYELVDNAGEVQEFRFFYAHVSPEHRQKTIAPAILVMVVPFSP